MIPYSKFGVWPHYPRLNHPLTPDQNLTALIDKILADMVKKDPSPSASRKLKLPDGLVLDPPSPGDWVLVDTYNATIIHDSLITDLVRVGYTYMVLPMRVSSLSPAELKVAIKAVEDSRPEGTPPSPPPDYTPSV